MGLARNVSLLRKALGDEGGDAAYIETIPRRGYRFIAPVTEKAALANPRRPFAWVAVGMALLAVLIYWQFYHPSRYLPARGDRAAMAVTSFECLPPDTAMSREFQEVLTAELAQLNVVQVISPGTVRRYQKVHVPMVWMARLLGLDVILEGAIQPLGDRDPSHGPPCRCTLGQIDLGCEFRHTARRVSRHSAGSGQENRPSSRLAAAPMIREELPQELRRCFGPDRGYLEP